MRSYGLLHVYRQNDSVYVSYNGNMGNTEANSVVPAFEQLYGEGSWPAVKARGQYVTDKYNVYSDASYSYCLKVPFVVWPYQDPGVD